LILPAQIAELPEYVRETIPADYEDEMGHMNVRWYVWLFSAGARALFTECGLDAAYRERTRHGTFARRQFLEYHREVLVGDTVRVHTRLLGRSEKRIWFKHFLVNETRDALAATLEATTVHVNLDERRSAPFPPEIASRIDAIVAAHQALTWDPEVCGIIGP